MNQSVEGTSGADPFQPPPSVSSPPDSDVQDSGPQSIGGWLILVAIGLILSPVLIIFQMANDYVPMFQNGTWEIITNPNSPEYISGFAAMAYFEIAANIFVTVAFFVMVVLFFMRSRYFPRVFIGITVVRLVLIVISGIWLTQVFADPALTAESISDALKTGVFALIWITYMLRSKRVRRTFVR